MVLNAIIFLVNTLTTNTVIKEVIQSKFDDAYPLEAYVNNYDVYQGKWYDIIEIWC